MSPGAFGCLCPSRTVKGKGTRETGGWWRGGKLNSKGSPSPNTWKNDLIQALNLLIRRLRIVFLGLQEKRKESSHSQMLKELEGE